MITKLIVENFKSFNEKAELTMLSFSKIRSKLEHRVSIGSNIKLLKYAIVYGANASGKSNLVDFLQFFKTTLEHGLPVNCVKDFCRNNKENEQKDSVFELQIEIEDKFYAYGFSARLADRCITGEWLYELYQNGSYKCIFEREANSKPKLDESIKLGKEDNVRFKTYSSDFEDNIVELFLSEMNRGKKFAEDSKLQVFKKIYSWIKNNIVIITPNSRLTNFQYYYDNDSLAIINDLITTLDTGISNVRVEEIDINELSKMLPKPILDDLIEKVKNKAMENGKSLFRMSGRSDTCFFSIEASGNDEPKITTIKFRHGESIYDFDFSDESDGTRRLFDLLDMLLTNKEDMVFVVDELERSIHPKLTEHFLKLFEERHNEHKVQLMFTTHGSSLMDQELFRRDEIWFVERDAKNNSKIYPLDKFKERYDKKLSKAYLEGRYGAVPEFNNFAFEREEE